MIYLRFLPIISFWFVYLVTCVFASIPLILGNSPFKLLLHYFSGLEVPEYDEAQTATFVLLLIGGGVLLSLGFFLAVFIFARGRSGDLTLRPRLEYGRQYIPWGIFICLGLIAIADLARVLSIDDLNAWRDYGQMVVARFKLFSQLGYFSFANLYVGIPTIAAWLFLVGAVKNGSVNRISWLAPAFSMFTLLFLFQKKAIVSALIFFLSSFLLFKAFENVKMHFPKKALGLGLSALAVTYFALVVLPVYHETTTTAEMAFSETVEDPNSMRSQLAAKIQSLLGTSRSVHIFAYSTLAPLTRTSVPAMFYPVVYPDKHAFIGLDLGQDILGIGEMPNDNKVIWEHMYGALPGSAAAPFQFVLYSQVGTLGALVLSAVLGCLMGCAWSVLLRYRASSPIAMSLYGGLIILFSVFIAIDSVRGALVASYGVIWGFLIVAIVSASVNWKRFSKFSVHNRS